MWVRYKVPWAWSSRLYPLLMVTVGSCLTPCTESRSPGPKWVRTSLAGALANPAQSANPCCKGRRRAWQTLQAKEQNSDRIISGGMVRWRCFSMRLPLTLGQDWLGHGRMPSIPSSSYPVTFLSPKHGGTREQTLWTPVVLRRGECGPLGKPWAGGPPEHHTFHPQCL